jgi:hypothetical protein
MKSSHGEPTTTRRHHHTQLNELEPIATTTTTTTDSKQTSILRKLMFANFEGFKIAFAMYIMVIATLMFNNKGILDDSRPLLLIFQTYLLSYLLQARKDDYEKSQGGRGDKRLLNYIFFQPLVPATITFTMYLFMRFFIFGDSSQLEQSFIVFAYFMAVSGAVIFYMFYITYRICKFILKYACCCCCGCGITCLRNEIEECFKEFGGIDDDEGGGGIAVKNNHKEKEDGNA